MTTSRPNRFDVEDGRPYLSPVFGCKGESQVLKGATLNPGYLAPKAAGVGTSGSGGKWGDGPRFLFGKVKKWNSIRSNPGV